MAGTDRTSSAELIPDALRRARSLPFGTLVRLIQEAHPDATPVGQQGPPRRECVRFRGVLDLGFHGSDVAAAAKVADDGSGFSGYEIAAGFLSLFGTDSPIPTYYTEELIDAELDGDHLGREFLDLFHHRLLSLFARGQDKHRHAAAYRWDGSDPLSRLLAALGDGGVAMRHGAIGAGSRVRFSGVLMRQCRSAEQIEAVLRDYFEDVPISVEPFVARRIPVPSDQLCRLGRSNSVLGEDAVLGEEVLDRSCTFGVHLGPLPRPLFERFLPGGDLAEELRDLLSHLNCDGLDCLLTLQLAPEQIGALQLGGEAGAGGRLGWSTWLGAGDQHAGSTVTILLEGWTS